VTLLGFLAVPLALLALAVRIDSEGPVIFRQSRVGKNGRLFDIYKFRSMRVDARSMDSLLQNQRIRESPGLDDF